MKDQDVPVPPLPAPLAFVIHLGPRARREAIRLTDALRRADIATWMAFGERGLRSQLREADKREVRFAVILGEDELARSVAAVRNMQDGQQSEVALAELVTWIQAQTSP